MEANNQDWNAESNVPQENWESREAQNDSSNIAGSRYDGVTGDDYSKTEDNYRFSDDPKEEDEASEEEETEEEQEERNSDWGDVDPQHSTFPSSNDPSFPGSAF